MAQLTDAFLAEIRLFPFNFAPSGWAVCNGQLLPISQNTALFALLGTVYGGDGKSTFALPDLGGRVPMHPTEDPGLIPHYLGEEGGSDYVTLLDSELPLHSHGMQISTQPGEDASPTGDALGRSVGAQLYQTTTNANLTTMAPQQLSLAGGSQPHNNLQPYLTLRFCIALQGIFPPRP